MYNPLDQSTGLMKTKKIKRPAQINISTRITGAVLRQGPIFQLRGPLIPVCKTTARFLIDDEVSYSLEAITYIILCKKYYERRSSNGACVHNK